MDILQEWFERDEELQSTGLFCHDVPEQLATLDHSDAGSATTVGRTLPLLSHATTPTAPPTEATITNSLLRSHSVDDIHQLSVNPSTSTSRELPCIPRCESYRCQSVFPALSCSNADSSHVEIALEMPRYLLQEDESALVDESGVSEEVSAASKTSHKSSAISSPVPPHRATTLPQRTNSSALPHKPSTVLSKASTPLLLATSVMPVEAPQTTKTDRLHGNQNSDPQHSRKSVSFSERRREGVDDAPQVKHSWSCDSHMTPGGPLTVCFPQLPHSSKAKQSTDGVRLINLHATPISIGPAPRPQTAPHVSNLCERKKRRHGGGWPKGKSRRVDSHASLPKPPATGYNIFLSEKRDCVREEHGTSSMSAVSKVMGQMWSQLSGEEKASYYTLAEQDRHRYVREMKAYFSQLYKGMSSVDIEEVESILTASTILENDDKALYCQICQISFVSLNNKLSHLSGRLHRQSVLEHVHTKLALSTKASPQPQVTPTADIIDLEERDGVECSDLEGQLTHVAMQHRASLEELTKAKQCYNDLMEAHADLQQQLSELEYMENCEQSVLDGVTREGISIMAALQSLSNALASVGVEHRAESEISTAGSFQQQPLRGDGGDRGDAPPP